MSVPFYDPNGGQGGEGSIIILSTTYKMAVERKSFEDECKGLDTAERLALWYERYFKGCERWEEE